jgi:16S rRNA (cytidine1402-2'-O)-methyltransferase
VTCKPLVLASTSPFRRELLARLGIPFDTVDPCLDESPRPGEAPETTALRLSEAKARAVASRFPDALIIGSDQVAVLDGQVYGKPGTHDAALGQLRAMRGRTVDFFTGLCLFDARADRARVRGVSTWVRFRDLSDAKIENYLVRERPYHCAGAAKSEGLGIALIARIQGDDPNALIGLPLIALCDLLEEAGYAVLETGDRGRNDSRREAPVTEPSPVSCPPSSEKGTLYLIPVPLGPSPARDVLPEAVIRRAARLRYFIAENAKSARAFLKSLPSDSPLQQIDIQSLDEHTPPEALPRRLVPLLAGHDAGLISEAGCPAVADPGAALVALAHAAGIPVAPLVGPSSLLLALMGSGLPGQNFAFHGYLPTKDEPRRKRILELEAESRRTGRTQMFIETPYRNRQVLEALIATCASHTRIGIATDLGLPGQRLMTLPCGDWKCRKLPDIDRHPTVFLLAA